MTIGDLKGWLKSIPDDFNDMLVLYRRYELPEQDGIKSEASFDAVDIPLVSGFIDEENKECCFLDDKSRTFIVEMNRRMQAEQNKEKG